MLEFQAENLKAPPRRFHTRSSRTAWILLWIVGLILLALILCVAAVANGWAKPRGDGHWLLVVHDSAYLPLKGALFTRWYPMSVFIWALVLLALCGWIFSVITGRPIFRGLHERWTRRALRNPGRRNRMLASARRLKRFGFKPRHLQNVLAAETHATLVRGLDDPKQHDNLLGLLEFRHALAKDHGEPGDDPVAILAEWQEAALVIQNRDGEAPREIPLAELGERLAGKLIPGGATTFPPWTRSGIAFDIQHLCRGGAPIELTRRQAERRRHIHLWVAQLQRGLVPNGIPVEVETPDNPGATGRLGALGVSHVLHWASLLGSPARADAPVQALLDDLGHLRFERRRNGWRFPDGTLSDLDAFLAGIPTDLHRDLAGTLQARGRAARDREAREAGLVEDGLLVLTAPTTTSRKGALA